MGIAILLIGIFSFTLLGGYFWLGICFMGLPHRCKICRTWCWNAICFECD